MEVMADRDVSQLNIELLSRNTHGHEQVMMEEEHTDKNHGAVIVYV